MVKRALLAGFIVISGVSWLQAQSLATGDKLSVPAGTMLHCRTTQALTTKLNYQGDTFSANVSEPVILGGREVIPAGATIEGRVARMERPGRIMGVGKMRLTAERLSFSDGRSYPLGATLMSAYGAEKARVAGSEGTIKGPSSRRQDAEEIAGGTLVGGLVGLFFLHPLVGAAAGGTLGLVDRLRRRGKDLSIPSGTQLNYQLTRPLEVYR